MLLEAYRDIRQGALLQRQTELWLERGRADGLLLRGDGLDESESWARATSLELRREERELLARSQAVRDG